MALTPKNKKHASQIEAGIVGRKKGHKFESVLATTINQLPNKTFVPSGNNTHIFHGNPATHLLQYIANNINITIMDARALWLGGLATSGKGDVLLDSHGSPITKSKSDVLIQITTSNGTETVGVSVKTCNKTTPTNDQMFFTTARAFCQLLRTNEIIVSEEAERGLSMFCGDIEFRPIDILPADKLRCRTSDPKRFYWEELSRQAQQDWKEIFDKYQDKITNVLKAGSSIKACLISEGKAEISYRLSSGTKEWDTAAFQIIVEEAGGLVLKLDKTKMYYNREDVYNREGYIIINRIENFLI